MSDDVVTQEDIVSLGNVEVEVNEDAVEPVEYFKILKSKLQKTEQQALENQLSTIATQLIAANKIGQKTFLHRLAFARQTIIKEQTLLALGYDTYVYREDVKAFLDKVTPKNSIKIIELDRYPRAIPLDILEKLDALKQQEIFDEFCVVFTDLTNEVYQTPEEKEFVARNRDPIIFGFFKHQKTGLKHDRFYFIADWEDEHCDLTFTKMVERMAEMKLPDPTKKITPDQDYLTELVKNIFEEMDAPDGRLGEGNLNVQKPKKSFWQRITGR